MLSDVLGAVSGVPSHPDLAEFVALLVQGHHHLVHDTSLAGSQKGAAVPFGVAPVGTVQLVVVLRQCHSFPYDHVLARDTNAGRYKAIVVQLVIDGVSHT